MGLIDFLFGRPLASDEESHQRVGPASGIPIFGLDALGSAAYGPEAALTVLIQLGAVGLGYAIQITIKIDVLLEIVYIFFQLSFDSHSTWRISTSCVGSNCTYIRE